MLPSSPPPHRHPRVAPGHTACRHRHPELRDRSASSPHLRRP